MEAAAVSGGPAPTGSKTIADLLPLAVAAHGAASAVQYKDDSDGWVTRTFDEVGEIVRALSLGLIELGIEPGDKVSILANTRPEWSYFDFAALTAGAIVVPIYQSNSPEECAYVLENSDAKAVIVEDEEQMEKIREVRDSAKKLEHVIRMTGASDDAISMEELTKRGSARADSDWEERWRAVKPDDICTFIYTSGTTGPPKGCVISHANYRAMVEMAAGAEVLETGKTTYLYLPLAHSFALLIQLLSFEVGGVIAYWERDPQRIVPNLAEVRPHYFPSVPRIFEKIYAAATGGAEQAGGVKKKLFDWAIGVGRKAKDRERSGRSLGAALKLQHALANRLVLSKIRALFGGRLITAVAGAAPINAEILRFFHAADVLVLEGWGMTETSTAATISMPSAYKFGTVGKPFKGCEVKIAADGEILVKGSNVFQGYYKNDEATAETIVDGWLHTGDIGEIDDEGYVKITGRKKDIIITAGGKNITPANIEAEIKQSQWVGEAVVVGDRKPYLVALVTLDADEAGKLAAQGLPSDPAQLAGNEQMYAMIEAHIDQLNEKFASVGQVKKFVILPQDLSIAGGELTPTLKVKRNVVVEKYAEEVEALYAG
jgi:long-chain acyl-CoA synthetase